MPKLKGDDNFKGKKLHSHDYRVPEEFEGLNVVVIGAGPSGLDIGLEITSHAKQVRLKLGLKILF